MSRPGKFEGEPAYVEAFWQQDPDDAWDDESGHWIMTFDISPGDIAEWPALAGVAVLVLWETDDGFVCSRTFQTRAAYLAVRETVETDTDTE